MNNTRDGGWIYGRNAHAVFEGAWQAAAPDGEPPCERQIENIFASGLPATRMVGERREFLRESVESVARAHAESDGRWRLLFSTEYGPWRDLWRINRRYSQGGVVELLNTALGASMAKDALGVSHRSFQRLLLEEEIPASRVGNTYFVARKGLEAYFRERRPSAEGVSEAGKKGRGKTDLSGVTSGLVKTSWWPA